MFGGFFIASWVFRCYRILVSARKRSVALERRCNSVIRTGVCSPQVYHISLQTIYRLSTSSLPALYILFYILLHIFSLHILYTVKSTSSQAPSSASLAKMFFHLHLMISPLPFGNEKESEKPGQLLTPASCHFSLSLKRLIQTAACF